jgi:hypothetical protein
LDGEWMLWIGVNRERRIMVKSAKIEGILIRGVEEDGGEDKRKFPHFIMLIIKCFIKYFKHFYSFKILTIIYQINKPDTVFGLLTSI